MSIRVKALFAFVLLINSSCSKSRNQFEIPPQVPFDCLNSSFRFPGGDDISFSVLELCTEATRNAAVRGDQSEWQFFKGIATDPNRHIGVRYHALDLACELANEDIAAEIVDLMNSFADRCEEAQKYEQNVWFGPAKDDAALLVQFVLDGAPKIQSTISDQKPLLDLLVRLLTNARCISHGRAWSKSQSLIAEAPADRAIRANAIFHFIEYHRKITVAPRPFLDVLNETDFPRLRELVRKSDHPDSFHFLAAATLSHFGDQEIVADLEARRPAFLKKHRNIEGYLIGDLWMISIQESDERLIEYIASDDPSVERRLWAIPRAAQRGIDKSAIRDAIYSFAETVDDEKRRVFGKLSSIKREGIRLGILSASDFPNVRVDLLGPICD